MQKEINKLLKNSLLKNSLAMAISASLLVACGGDGGGSSNSNNNSQEAEESSNPNENSNPNQNSEDTQTTKIVSTIVDTKGNAVADATVELAGKSKTTNAAGQVTITADASKDKVTILIKKAGYITTAKQVVLNEGDNSIKVTLFADQVTTSFDSAKGTTVENKDKTAQVTIPSNAIVDANGSAYTGKVNVAMSYYSPEELNGVQAFAQPYVGEQDDGSGNVGLMSVGVTEVKLTDEQGKPLQLDGNNKATLTYPANTVSGNKNSIPLWYYDEDKMIWVEDGIATKQADGSYQGKVDHFTLWNIDIPIKDEATVKGCFEDKNGKKVNISSRITTTGWSNYGFSENGMFEVRVPAGEPLTLYPGSGGKITPVSIPALKVGQTKDYTNVCFVVDTSLPVIERIELPPVARDNTKNGLVGKTLVGNVIRDIDGVDTDGNGDTITVTGYSLDSNGDGITENFSQSDVTTINGKGRFSIAADGSYEFVPVSNFEGELVVEYSISDSNGGTDTANLTIKISKPEVSTPINADYILGYRLIAREIYANGAAKVEDLIISTYYIEGGYFKEKYESVLGLPIPNNVFDYDEYTAYYLSSSSNLIKDKDIKENNIIYSKAYNVDVSGDGSFTGYLRADNSVKTTVNYSSQGIAGKNITGIFGYDDTVNSSIRAKVATLPANERVFASGQTCSYLSTIAHSKSSLEFFLGDDAKAGKQTINDLNSQASFDSSISGTWAGIPWIASTAKDEYGDSDVYVLYDGNVIKSDDGFSNAGTFNLPFESCDFYTKEQVDFVIKAMQKLYPNLKP